MKFRRASSTSGSIHSTWAAPFASDENRRACFSTWTTSSYRVTFQNPSPSSGPSCQYTGASRRSSSKTSQGSRSAKRSWSSRSTWSRVRSGMPVCLQYPAPDYNRRGSATAGASTLSAMPKRANPYQRADRYTQSARDRGYPARSVFKLEDLDRRAKLLRGGHARARSGGRARARGRSTPPSAWARQGRVLAVDLSAARDRAARQRGGDPGRRVRPRRRGARGLRALRRGAVRHGARHDRLEDPRTRSARRRWWSARSPSPTRSRSRARRSSRSCSWAASTTPSGRSCRSATRRCRTLRPEGVRKQSVEVFLVATGRRA